MNKRILIAEVDGDLLNTLSLELAMENYEVIRAKSGKEAIRQILVKRPDLILVNLDLFPDEGRPLWQVMNCLEFSVPVMVMANAPTLPKFTIFHHLDAIIFKPLDMRRLLYTIALLLLESPAARCLRLGDPDFAPICLPNADEAETRFGSADLLVPIS